MASHTQPSSHATMPAWARPLPLILIVAGGLGALIGGFMDPQQLGFSYLVAFMFFLSLCLGGLFLTILHHLFDASWSVPVRRVTEHMACLLPVMGFLFIPIAILARKIYPWMSIHADTDHALHAKAALINPLMFYVVAFVLFAIWTFLSWRLRYWSLKQDQTGEARCTYAMRLHSAWGIFAFALTLTLGAIFWVKSLQHQWFSTMYGVYYFAGSVWTTLATLYVLTAVLNRTGPLAIVTHQRQFHDIAVLMFAFTVFYTYIHFSQYFLIWNAAIPEETFWYVLRERGIWWEVGMVIVFGHFVAPFLLLLRIDAKLSFGLMIPICIWAWIMHFLDMAYNITPVLHIFRQALALGGDLAHNIIDYTQVGPEGAVVHWMDFACLAFIGGVLALVFVRFFKNHAPYPIKDPRLGESLAPLGHVTDSLVAETHKGAE